MKNLNVTFVLNTLFKCVLNCVKKKQSRMYRSLFLPQNEKIKKAIETFYLANVTFFSKFRVNITQF